MTRDLTHYEEICDKIEERVKVVAKESVPDMYWELRDQEFEVQEARDKVTKDGMERFGWKKGTIEKALPDESKDKEKADAGAKGGRAKAEHERDRIDSQNGTATRKANQIEEFEHEIIVPEEVCREIMNAMFTSVDHGVRIYMVKYAYRRVVPNKPKSALEPLTPKASYVSSSAPIKSG
jgi:hypothetical protein